MREIRITRTRFAPSPTGLLHIGGLRTALINYLFAKKNSGEFILRIEDTDLERNQEGLEEAILDNLESFSLVPDESFRAPGGFGPYLQSQRMERYTKRAEELLQKGQAYRCFCRDSEELSDSQEEGKRYFYSGKCRELSDGEVQERLERGESYSIRLKIDREKVYSWEDYVRGEMSIPASSMGDIVLVRSNGIPTYNFAATVDDYEMEISDVFRGEEHLSNTPYQLALYEAFGWKDFTPNFGHLSLILSEEGKKISKRDKDAEKYCVNYLIEKGYYPEAILNYLLILGWTFEEREIFSLREGIELFTTKNLSSSPSTFDQKKLDWMSQFYLNKLDAWQYLNFSLPFFKTKFEENFNLTEEQKREFALRFRSRVKYGGILDELAGAFYSESYLSQEVIDELKVDREIFLFLRECIQPFREFQTLENQEEEETIKLFLKKVFSKSYKDRHFMYSNLRLALIGEKEGLPLHSVIFLLGGPKTLWRLERVVNLLSNSIN